MRDRRSVLNLEDGIIGIEIVCKQLWQYRGGQKEDATGHTLYVLYFLSHQKRRLLFHKAVFAFFREKTNLERG